MSSCLDSMKASSLRNSLHPSALDGRFDVPAAAAEGKQVAVSPDDDDGTLSPIVEGPDRAVMTDEEVRAVP
jgi:trehalose 6-phosphate phosphatase